MTRRSHGLADPLALGANAERVLRWLERYPLQRARDLLVALAPWEKRTMLYEHLAELEHAHLIEGVRSGSAPGIRLYTLSPLGNALCDYLAAQRSPANPAALLRAQRWEQQGVASVVRAEREKLIRSLPRLPVWLRVQDAINSLVLRAPGALTEQGRRPDIVQWDWQRDYQHRFAGPHERSLQLHAEGVLTIGVRFPAEAPLPGSPTAIQAAERWYTILLLYCPLDEPSLLRWRLDRLLRWRESRERSNLARSMPLVLVLATTERQAEWWHQSARQAAARLRLDPLLGALICLTGVDTDQASYWHLPWRRLGSGESCQAQALLRPWRAPTIVERRPMPGGEKTSKPGVAEDDPGALEWKGALPSRLRRRSYALNAPAPHGQHAAGRVGERAVGTRDARLESLWLTPRHWELLLLCLAHPLLSRDDLCAFLALSRTTINLLLADLKRGGYLAGTETPLEERWQLTEAGLWLLARLAACRVQRLSQTPAKPDAPVQQRGVLGLLRTLQHTAGVYAFFATLTRALATCANARVRWWETGAISERLFSYRGKTYRFRPDGLASVQIDERTFRFWLEWDRGTMTSRSLRVKFTTYAMYLASREWASSSPFLPALLCVTPDIAQEQRLTQAAIARLTQAPVAFQVYTTTAGLLVLRGILAPIWRSVERTATTPQRSDQPSQRSPPTPHPRMAVFVPHTSAQETERPVVSEEQLKKE